MDPFEAAIDVMSLAADGLGQAESLFDTFAVIDRQGVSFVPWGAGFDCWITRFLGNMRGNTGMPEIRTELGRVEALVSVQRQPSGRPWGVAMDHVEGGAPLCMTVEPALAKPEIRMRLTARLGSRIRGKSRCPQVDRGLLPKAPSLRP